MPTRRQLIQALPAAGAAFAIGHHWLSLEGQAHATPQSPLRGHFHPKGKAPSKFTLEVLEKAEGDPAVCATSSDFEEQKRGLIAPMKDMKIMADAGHVAWDMERFQFLDTARRVRQHPPLAAPHLELNNNYGLYEVIPGIYQVRGFDLSDITFVRGKTGWIVFDPLVSAETGPRRLEAVPGARRRRPARLGGDLLAHAWRPLGRRARHSSMKRMCGRARFRSSLPSTSWTSRSPRTSTPATP